jgi:hypothetical protein
MGPKILLKGTQFWPEQGPELNTPADIQNAYENLRLAGAYFEPEERDALIAENIALTGFGQFEDAATAGNFASSGEGKLSIPFVHLLEAYPGCYPGPAQVEGDCVSHNQKNAGLLTYVCEVIAGAPDEVTGHREELPKVSAEGIKGGVFSPEAIYWWRRSASHGWYGGAACRVTQKESGLWLRKKYPEVDLTSYTKATVNKYGRTPPTGNLSQQGQANLIRAFAQVKTREGRRDALHNGYALSTCGGESFSNKRDQWGVSSRTREGWAHAFAFWGFDDRASTKQLYGDSLELCPNSWGVWNSGSRDIRDSASFVPPAKRQLWINLGIVNAQSGNIMIPPGSFWAKSKDVAARECFAMSSVNGWPRKNLDFLLASPLG